MSERQIAVDLRRKISESVRDTVMREMAIAQPVLDSAEIAYILLGLAKGAVGTAAGSIASIAGPADRSKIYLEVVDQIAEMSRADVDEAVMKIAAARGETRP